MIDGVSIGLAVPGLAELLIKVVKKFKKVVHKYGNAKEFVEYTSLIFEDHVQKLQLEIQEFVNLSPNLPEHVCVHLGKLFMTLKAKLAAFESELDSLLEADQLLGVMVVKSSIEDMTKEVDFWQRKIEDFFSLLARLPKSFRDQNIPNLETAVGRVQLVNQAIFSATESTPAKLDWTGKPMLGVPEALPESPVYVVKSAALDEMIILEVKRISAKITGTRLEIIRKDVIDLARVLSAQDIFTRGILRCKGYKYCEMQVNTETHKEFQLLFEVPKNLIKPRSLRHMLLDKDFKGQISHPLNERLSLAKQLARAVLHVHSKGHVHKNIRPETILLFETFNSDPNTNSARPDHSKAFPFSLGTAFLTGFERVRKDESDTVPIENTNWAEDIYRHPSKQAGPYPEEKYTMLHDIYSLGVCLLEIAMWRSFVELVTDSNNIVMVNNTKACNLTEGGKSSHQKLLSPQKIQQKFIRDAERRIPIALGEKYSQAVVRCLSCLEKFTSNTETEGSETVVLGVKYIETILSQLEEIEL